MSQAQRPTIQDKHLHRSESYFVCDAKPLGAIHTIVVAVLVRLTEVASVNFAVPEP